MFVLLIKTSGVRMVKRSVRDVCPVASAPIRMPWESGVPDFSVVLLAGVAVKLEEIP